MVLRHFFDEALGLKLLQSSTGQGAADLQPFRHNRGSDKPVAGNFLIQLVIGGFVKENQVVQLISDFSLGPLLLVSKQRSTDLGVHSFAFATKVRKKMVVLLRVNNCI